MTYNELIEFCNPVSVKGTPPGQLGSLCQDSRSISPGDIFIAIKGTQTDGHNYISSAVEQGASVIISEQELSGDLPAALLRVKDTRSLLSPLAQKLAGDPAKELLMIGVTGTNGKTTVATLVWQVLRKLGHGAALLGTISKKINDEVMTSRLTTADPIELAADMQKMVAAGCRYMVMEVSSHALHQKRVEGLRFEVAAYTNLSHDHLDYHQTMEEYAAAKKMLFDSLSKTCWAITNADDEYGMYMVQDTEARVLDFSFRGNALINGRVEETSAAGTSIGVEGIKVYTPLIGYFNAVNVLEAMVICTALGFDGKTIASVLGECKGAEGRMERVSINGNEGEHPVVIVDYAHTPDALKNVASTLADLKTDSQKLIIVFGCGGDRDKSKRPAMAKIAETYADEVIVTSDNPRSEDPVAIIEDITEGFSKDFSYRAIPSRKEAIHVAISEADGDTIVLIAGKGHETYQEINGIRKHFDDREEASTALSWRKGQTKNCEVN
jgi:UDP-N-acetylmuramoyl-L-alanyl-D-glutamate--2,6-diaminopimelate ligase